MSEEKANEDLYMPEGAIILDIVSGLLCAARDAKEMTPALVVEWLDQRLGVGSVPGIYERFGKVIWRVRYVMLKKLVETYIPPEMIERARLQDFPKTDKELIEPIELLRQAFDATLQVRFEARRDLALGYLILSLELEPERTEDCYPNLNPQDSGANERMDEVFVLQHLQRAGVIADLGEEVTLLAAQDPEPPHRCRAAHVERNGLLLPFFEHNRLADRVIATCRLLYMQDAERTLALMFKRRKDPLSTVAKMIQSGAPTPWHVLDRRGIRFAYRNTDELLRGSQFFMERVGRSPAYKNHTNPTDRTANPHAAPELILIKDVALFGRQEFEHQHVLVNQLVDVLVSHGPENYLLYHLRQYVGKPAT